MKEADLEEAFFKSLGIVSTALWTEEAESLRQKISAWIKANRSSWIENEKTLKSRENRGKWMAYVLRLILTCPPLLESPSGFEWVMEDFKQILELRKIQPEWEADFWKAIKRTQAAVRKGRPSRRDKDYSRYMMSRHKMEKDKLIKTEAVEKWAQEEAIMDEEGRSDTSGIWKSLNRVERERKEFEKLLDPNSTIEDFICFHEKVK